MEQEAFYDQLSALAPQLEAIRQRAHQIHEDVNQTYDGVHPYGYHLDMVAENVKRYGSEIIENPADVAAVIFGAYFHDSIEDARLTYNNVLKEAKELVGEERARMAAEIAYALTNEKGRTRAERANAVYYQGICTTPYAPMVKLADRLANTEYSCRGSNSENQLMREVYVTEMPHFIQAISQGDKDDPRLKLPPKMLEALTELFNINRD